MDFYLSRCISTVKVLYMVGLKMYIYINFLMTMEMHVGWQG